MREDLEIVSLAILPEDMLQEQTRQLKDYART